MTELEAKLLYAAKDLMAEIDHPSIVKHYHPVANRLREAIAAAEAAQPDEVQRAVEAEREACIKICSELASDLFNPDRNGAIDCLKAIRARSNK